MFPGVFSAALFSVPLCSSTIVYENWRGGGGPLSGATVTLFFSADRPILPPVTLRLSPPMIQYENTFSTTNYTNCTNRQKAIYFFGLRSSRYDVHILQRQRALCGPGCFDDGRISCLLTASEPRSPHPWSMLSIHSCRIYRAGNNNWC